MDSSDTGAGHDQAGAEAHRHLLQFLRGLRQLDATLGPWRPDYGSLPAAETADAAPPTRAGVIEAHRLYAEGLGFFGDHPGMAELLGRPEADDIAAALTDAQRRFRSAAVPLDVLVEVAAPAGEEAEDAGTQTGGGAAAPSARVAQSPWEAERSAAAPPGSGAARGRRGRGAPGNGGPSGDEPAPRAMSRSFAIAMSLAALLLAAILVTAVVLGTHVLLGSGPTAAAPPASPTSATLPPSDLPSGSPPDVLAPVAACAAIPSGQVPTGLTIASTTSGIGLDPAAGYSNPYVKIVLGGTVGSGTAAFSLVTVVLPFDVTPPAATSTPVNSAGTFQLIAYWDGSRWHGALRSWSGSAWTLKVDVGSGVDVVQRGTGVTVFWEGLVTGDRYGVIVAASGGCAGLGLDSALAPEQSYGTEPSSS